MVDLPKGWGILFAIDMMPKDVIYTKTRLNKILSILQREGFPIENKFINATWGPYDGDIHKTAEIFDSEGLIKIDEIPTGHDNSKFNYTLCKKGKEQLNENIYPKIKEIWSKGFARGYSKTIIHSLNHNNEQLVKSVHQDLFLDDINEFITALISSKNYYYSISSEGNKVKFCPRDIEKLGIAQYTYEALQNIEDFHLPGIDDRSGKNHVLYNALRLKRIFNMFQLGKPFDECIQSNKCLMRGDDSHPCIYIRSFLNHYMHCIEYNSNLYEIQGFIDIEKYNFVEFMD